MGTVEDNLADTTLQALVCQGRSSSDDRDGARPNLTYPSCPNGSVGDRECDDQFSAKSSMIRQCIEGFKPWIEGRLGVAMGEMIQLRFDHSISMIAASKCCRECSSVGVKKVLNVYFKTDCVALNFHPTTCPPSP